MVFTELQPAAFIPDPGNGPFHADLHTLTFPAAWREPVLDLYRSGRSEAAQARIKQVPIRKLNSLIRTVAPDLVTVDANASFDAAQPWLYTRTVYPMCVLARLVHAWLRSLAPTAEEFQRFRETARTLDVDSLRWQPETVDLLEHDLSPGGTCVPASRLYRVLPEILADRIAAQPPYKFCGERVQFHRVAVDARANGAELMSWPPLKHRTKVKDKDAQKRYGTHRDWYYSAIITVSLRTVPFSPTPRIYLSTRIRRWVSGQVPMSGTRRVSAYLLTHQPFITDGRQPHRFAVAQFAWNRYTRQIEWAQGGTEGMLVRVGAIDNLPAADVFAKEPDTWIPGRDGVEGAASYHTMMGWHGVGAGLMPAERRRLTEWAGAALAPEFVPALPLVRSTINQNPTALLTPKVAVPKKDATEEQVADAVATNQLIEFDNALRRREFAALALTGRDLTAIMLYQSTYMRDQFINAAEASLGLADYRDVTGPDLWSWNTPDLHVRIHARELGALGAPLGNIDQPPKKGTEHIDAIGHRRTAVASRLRDLAAHLGETTVITFVELDGRAKFKHRTTDPKFAIRLGCADAGMVSQFFTPTDQNPDNDDDSQFRATAAWADGLRQLGMRLVPPHTLGDKIPDNLNQLAFWIVKRQVTGETERAQFTPVAVLIRPGQRCILGRTPDMTEWVPYPQLLVALTGQVRPEELSTAGQQTKTVAAFVQNILYTMRGTPTLVITHAQNTRSRWPWLKNPGLLPDRIQFGNGPAQRIKLFGQNLRIARLATNDRDETPQWWAPKSNESGGISKGLWKPIDGDDNNRVFYSTSNKPGTHTLSVESTKLTHRINSKGDPEIRPGKNAWNPELLEIAMLGFSTETEAEYWAMFLHQQRLAEDYRDALALPLIQHVTELTSQYGLPHEDEPDEPLDNPDDEADAVIEPN
jgi:pPIWI_RE module N-terminal domain/RNaseH domain of pPIWI_RE/MID domain of pPIWI_RE